MNLEDESSPSHRHAAHCIYCDVICHCLPCSVQPDKGQFHARRDHASRESVSQFVGGRTEKMLVPSRLSGAAATGKPAC